MEDPRKSYESTPEYENVTNFLSVECEKKKVWLVMVVRRRKSADRSVGDLKLGYKFFSD